MSLDWLRPSVLTVVMMAAGTPSAADDLASALAVCRAEKDDARRLACYDREAGKLGKLPAMGTEAPSGDAAAPAAERTSEERFGYRGSMARAEREREEKETRALEGLVSTVTAISARPDKTLVVTLENGQIWTQNRPDAFFRLTAGEQVKIEPALLGSFMMINSSKRTARVTRQK